MDTFLSLMMKWKYGEKIKRGLSKYTDFLREYILLKS